jgi:hypothetical protein
MAHALLDALPDEQVLQANSLATVTRQSVLLREADGQSHAILPLDRIEHVQNLKTTYPGLLVIASALALLAAAAQSSKEGHGAAIPLGIIAIVFLLLYINSRKASVLFRVEGERFETIQGTLRDAAAITEAIKEAQKRLTSLAA